MRVSCFYIVLLACSMQLLMAHSGNSQALDELTLTLEIKNENLGSLLKKINEETGLTFSYPSDEVRKVKAITLPRAQRSVEEILNTVLEGTRLAWRQVDAKMVLIYIDAEKEKQKEENNNITLTAKEPTVFMVTGTVTNGSTQLALAGVNIVVKGTTRGTTTDVNGKFAIEAIATETLVFTFIGFKAFETQVGERTMIDVAMEADIQALEAVEVRSTGYWTDTKERSTGNIAKVTAEEIERQPVTSPLMALQGRMAGVDVVPNNGVPGSAVKIQIRGNNSLRFDGSYPLYVVDGVPLNSTPIESSGQTSGNFDPLATINPANIESIEVLKDGAATAIYGSRGANGVILIKTKQNSNPGKTNLDVSLYTGIGKLTNRIDVLNTEQYLAMRHEAQENRGVTPGPADWDLTKWDSTRYTNWQDELLGGSVNILDLQASISGGDNYTSFRFGGSLHKEKVIYPGDFGYHNITSNLSINHRSTDQKFNASILVNYGTNQNNLFSDLNYVSNALTLPPNAPELYNEIKELNWELVDYFGFPANSWTNPLSDLKNTHDVESENLIANSSLSYEPMPDLIFKLNSGFTSFNASEVVKNPISARPPFPGYTGRSTFGKNKRQSWILEPQFSYQKSIDHHNLSVVVGATWQTSRYNYQGITGNGYTSDVLLNTIRGASTQFFIADDETEYKYFSVFSRVGYDWNSKYLLDIIGRRDGSSRFGPDQRFGNFGAVGIGWIFSKEPFIGNNMRFISFGKIRASYGFTGNDQIGDYKYYNTYDIAHGRYQGGVTLYPTALYNPDFAWEVTKKIESTIELGFLENRVSMQLSWYRNRSSNQLVNYTLPSTTGFTSILKNFDAIIENSGWEFVLNTKNVERKAFRWTTSFNLSIPENKLVKYDRIEDSPYALTYKVGEPLSAVRNYKWTGVDPITGEHTYLDVNNDGLLNGSDMYFERARRRKYYGGLINYFRYKSFEFSFLLQFVNQNVSRLYAGLPGTQTNQPVEVLNRWRNEGDATNIQKYWDRASTQTGRAYNSYLFNSSYNIQDGSFIRLKTVSLSYHFSNEILKRAMLGDASIYFQAQNLLTISNYVGLDPETQISLPPLQIMSIGIQVKL